ncbi:hypothetical protein [Pseudoclavibacter sp. AY1H1]|uniref:hypothetical protein n=1 Tax=Pseudoclavibacter sp. AY1H1 TaxID=2080584 RepID=UPI000CE880BE|nr:hypothetical protein [Pseudoclavibacter sp. AY1H1]PPF39947.1 hypothetical protein C5E05_01675 [Pseudoclavibacter sp. AY1H1]
MNALEQAEKRVRDAKHDLDAKQQAFAAARARSSAITPGGLDEPLDHGVLSGTSRRSNARANARREAAYDAEASAARALTLAKQELEAAQFRVEQTRLTAPVEYTREQLEAATHVRTWRGWERIVRVNRASVKVFREPGMDDLVKVDKILEVR